MIVHRPSRAEPAESQPFPARPDPFASHHGLELPDANATFTRVELTWRRKRIEHRMRFGHPIRRERLDRERRSLWFEAGSIFAITRWAANDYGTVVSRIDILRAVQPGAPFTELPFVAPGGDVLLSISGWPKVKRVLQAIDAIEALRIHPAEAAPEHWQHVHNRITVGETPRSYSHSRHQAWLKRRRIAP